MPNDIKHPVELTRITFYTYRRNQLREHLEREAEYLINATTLIRLARLVDKHPDKKDTTGFIPKLKSFYEERGIDYDVNDIGNLASGCLKAGSRDTFLAVYSDNFQQKDTAEAEFYWQHLTDLKEAIIAFRSIQGLLSSRRPKSLDDLMAMQIILDNAVNNEEHLAIRPALKGCLVWKPITPAFDYLVHTLLDDIGRLMEHYSTQVNQLGYYEPAPSRSLESRPRGEDFTASCAKFGKQLDMGAEQASAVSAEQASEVSVEQASEVSVEQTSEASVGQVLATEYGTKECLEVLSTLEQKVHKLRENSLDARKFSAICEALTECRRKPEHKKIHRDLDRLIVRMYTRSTRVQSKVVYPPCITSCLANFAHMTAFSPRQPVDSVVEQAVAATFEGGSRRRSISTKR